MKQKNEASVLCDCSFGPPILELNDVGLQYRLKNDYMKVLHNINLKVSKGEFVCILGPSGCGKSSLLRLIAGFEGVSEGNIQYIGVEQQHNNQSYGFVFQNDYLFDWLNVRDNINYGLRMQHFDKKTIVQRTKEMINKMGLMGFEDHKTFELSGGMRQRVSIGRVLINNPGIVLMDEPFSSLDAFTREELQDFLRDLWISNKTTVIFVTHDIDEALVLGTRIIVLSKRPGTIIGDMKRKFTYDIASRNNSRKNLSNDYFVARREIYEMLCS